MASPSISYAATATRVATSGRLAVARLPLAALLTIALATLVNVALFFLFSAVGFITPAVEISTFAGPQPLEPVMVVSMTVIQMLLGVLVLAGIIRFRRTDAERTWQIVAAVVLVLSFAVPFAGIPGAPLSYDLALDAMHVVAGMLAIWMLPALARRR
jgi:Family of unknown function (DUF6069)